MPISMPAIPNFVRSGFGLEAHTQTFTSPLTRNTQRLVLPGARWTASYTIRRMHSREPLAAEWIAFFLQCGGMANAFDAHDPDRSNPRGTPSGTPLVKGAGQTGTTLLIDGCTPSVSGWLLPGDFFSAGGELKQITQPVDTDGSGEATLNFRPAFRTSPADNAAITVSGATCTMILADDMQGILQSDHHGVYEEHTFSAVEVF